MAFTEDPLINWQKNHKNWPERMAFIKQKENLADFKFIVGPEKTIFQAHKLIFAISSPEFENLFYLLGSDMREILLPDVTPEIFNQFLDFVYTGKVTITIENIGELLKLSKRYVMTLLTDKCQDFLEKAIKKDNVFQVLEISDDFPALESKCLKIIGNNTIELFESPEFVKISINSLKKIVEYEMLHEERALFEAVNKWSESALSEAILEETSEVTSEVKLENKRLLVGGLVKKIRLGAAMSYDEFLKCSTGDSILTSTEIVFIFKNFKSTTVDHLFFKKRLAQANIADLPLKRCLRFENCPIGTFGSLGGYTEFNFSVDKHVYLCGYGIYGRTPDALEKYKISKVDIRISDDSGNVLSEKSEKITFHGTNRIFDVFFKTPVLIEPFKSYMVYSCKSGPTNVFQNFWGTDGRTEIEQNGVTFKITKSNDTTFAYDTAKRCAIADLLFKN